MKENCIECFKNFDYFGYTPQFNINGEKAFKSKTGAILFLIFIIFALFFFFSQFGSFIKNHDVVSNSRDSTSYSSYYNFTVKDMYFGIGLIDFDGKFLNLSDYPFLEFSLYERIENNDSVLSSNFSLGKCNASFFYNNITWSKIDLSAKNIILQKLDKLLCPEKGNFDFKLYPDNFEKDDNYLVLKLSIKNVKDINISKELLFSKKPRVILLPKSFVVNTDDKLNPFTPIIEPIIVDIDYEFFKIYEMMLNPFELIEDDEMFILDGSHYLKTEFSSQTNGTIFVVENTYQTFKLFSDRFKTNLSKNNLELSLLDFTFHLNPLIKRTKRIYPKFSDFLAGVTSVLSNLLLIFVIIMKNLNEIKGKNMMLGKIFPYDMIKDIREFKVDLKTQINVMRSSLFRSKNPSILSKKSTMNEILTKQVEEKNHINKGVKNDSNLEEISFSKFQKEEDQEIIVRKEEKTNHIAFENKQMINKEDISNNQKNDQKIFDLNDILQAENFKFSIIDYLKTNISDNKTLIYNYGYTNLTKALDIQTYLKLKHEISLIKEVLFDEHQLKTFNVLSQFEVFKKLFNDIKKDDYKLRNINSEKKKEIFDSMMLLYNRRNKLDQKLLIVIDSIII